MYIYGSSWDSVQRLPKWVVSLMLYSVTPKDSTLVAMAPPTSNLLDWWWAARRFVFISSICRQPVTANHRLCGWCSSVTASRGAFAIAFLYPPIFQQKLQLQQTCMHMYARLFYMYHAHAFFSSRYAHLLSEISFVTWTQLGPTNLDIGSWSYLVPIPVVLISNISKYSSAFTPQTTIYRRVELTEKWWTRPKQTEKAKSWSCHLWAWSIFNLKITVLVPR